MNPTDQSPASLPHVFFCFRSAYNEPLTPSSNTSLSPVGSPVSEITFEKPSLPSAADWSEFLSASTSEKVENEFAQLTLSDHEQRELYEAARLVQTAFRKYKVKDKSPRDFPGDPVVKTLSYHCRGARVQIPGQGTKISHALQPKIKNFLKKQKNRQQSPLVIREKSDSFKLKYICHFFLFLSL